MNKRQALDDILTVARVFSKHDVEAAKIWDVLGRVIEAVATDENLKRIADALLDSIEVHWGANPAVGAACERVRATFNIPDNDDENGWEAPEQ